MIGSREKEPAIRSVFCYSLFHAALILYPLALRERSPKGVQDPIRVLSSYCPHDPPKPVLAFDLFEMVTIRLSYRGQPEYIR